MTLDRTPKRLKITKEVDRSEFRWYHLIRPEARNVVTDKVETDVLAVLAEHGIVDIGTADPGSYSVPVVTEYGREWAGIPAPVEMSIGAFITSVTHDEPPRPPYGSAERAVYDAEHGPAPWLDSTGGGE